MVSPEKISLSLNNKKTLVLFPDKNDNIGYESFKAKMNMIKNTLTMGNI